jgi:hypothetical protein
MHEGKVENIVEYIYLGRQHVLSHWYPSSTSLILSLFHRQDEVLVGSLLRFRDPLCGFPF